MNSPGFQRVTLIPMKTSLFSSENSHTVAFIFIFQRTTLLYNLPSVNTHPFFRLNTKIFPNQSNLNF